jgi:hypothetical protein
MSKIIISNLIQNDELTEVSQEEQSNVIGGLDGGFAFVSGSSGGAWSMGVGFSSPSGGSIGFGVAFGAGSAMPHFAVVQK